jgi:acetyl esterase/lipase
MRPLLGFWSIFASLLAFGAVSLRGAQQVIDLWPEGVPGLKAGASAEKSDDQGRVWNIHHPSLTVYPAAHPNGSAVIICPGGGYLRLSFRHEGIEPAEFLNARGVTAFIIKNRLVEYGQPAPLQDVLRAIRLVRSRAKELGLNPEHIGVMGFSAGGHLAATAGTLYADPMGMTGNLLDAYSARPDFMILVYPVITMKDPYVHAGSRKALLGANPSDEMITQWSAELQVNAQTPPAFLVATEEDHTVPPKNSLLFYEALRKAGVSAELHLFEKGPHGFGLRTGYGPTSEWPLRAAEWMTAHGWIPESRK